MLFNPFIKLAVAMTLPSPHRLGSAGGVRSVGGSKNTGTQASDISHLHRVHTAGPNFGAAGANTALSKTPAGGPSVGTKSTAMPATASPTPSASNVGKTARSLAPSFKKLADVDAGVRRFYPPGLTKEPDFGPVVDPLTSLHRWQHYPVLKENPGFVPAPGAQRAMAHKTSEMGNPMLHQPLPADVPAHLQVGRLPIHKRLLHTAVNMFEGAGNRALDIVEANNRESRRPMDPTLAQAAPQAQLY
jgi:hypothetical protein